MLISVAICDDQKELVKHLEDNLFDIAKEINIELKIDVYFDGSGICNNLCREKYDLIFLDIEMPQIDGVEVGKYIREKLKDEVTQIAYISAKKEHAMELFESRPINFLVKPLQRNDIKKVIEKYLVLQEDLQKVFRYMKKREILQIVLGDIIYFERCGRKVIIHTKDGTDDFYETLENVYSRVKKNKFLFIHKSIIVNCNYVKKMAYEEVTLTDDTLLAISQSRRKEIRTMWMNYLAEDGE